jgi:hypothetical protein
MEENKKLVATCRPDYEREYHRLIKENAQLMAENDILRKTIIEMCKSLFVKGGEG